MVIYYDTALSDWNCSIYHNHYIAVKKTYSYISMNTVLDALNIFITIVLCVL